MESSNPSDRRGEKYRKNNELIQSGAAEQFRKFIIESAKDFAIFTLDLNRRINSWSVGAQNICQYSEEEIIGQLGDILFIPEDQATNAAARETERAAREGSAKNERWHLRKDGSRFWGSGLTFPLQNENDTIIGFVKIMRDLTDQRRAEQELQETTERLRVTLESASDYSIITLDTEGNIEGWSKGAELSFGYKESEAVGNYGDIIFTREDREAHIPEMEMATAMREGIARDERWHRRKDGSRFYMSGTMRPIYNPQLAGFVKVARDMTEQKLTEQQKDEFIGIASHELKTPVTTIKAYIELLQDTMDESASRESNSILHKLGAQVDRLTGLIQTLLDTTRIAEGRLMLQSESFNMNELVKQQAEEFAQLTVRHNIIVQPGQIPQVWADRERITQVLTNLISNAIKYSPSGGDIIITTEVENDSVKTGVRDAGIGMSPDTNSKVFERFYRAGNAQVQTFPGMGLGLYIAAEIVKRHNGTIWVESELNKGSVFYFTIPLDIR